MMYGVRMLAVAHCGNFCRKIPLAPVMMVAVRVPDWASVKMAVHACSSVYWCKSNVACVDGGGGVVGMRCDRRNSDRTARRVAGSLGTKLMPAISAMSWSVNCFIVVMIEHILTIATLMGAFKYQYTFDIHQVAFTAYQVPTMANENVFDVRTLVNADF